MRRARRSGAARWRTRRPSGLMVFTDTTFFLFFPLAFAVYWWLGDNQSRKIWLLACSVIFYAAWDWRFLGLVLLDIVNTYAVTRLVGEWAPEKWRKPIL